MLQIGFFSEKTISQLPWWICCCSSRVSLLLELLWVTGLHAFVLPIPTILGMKIIISTYLRRADYTKHFYYTYVSHTYSLLHLSAQWAIFLIFQGDNARFKMLCYLLLLTTVHSEQFSSFFREISLNHLLLRLISTLLKQTNAKADDSNFNARIKIISSLLFKYEP